MIIVLTIELPDSLESSPSTQRWDRVAKYGRKLQIQVR